MSDLTQIFLFRQAARGQGLMLGNLRAAKKKTVGTKQTLKAVSKGNAKVVFVAGDAEEHIIRGLIKACAENGVEVVRVETMTELGEACGIEIGAAAAAITEE